MHQKTSIAGEPDHVRAAPSHRNPYPYYARLARQQPFFRDDANGWWVAASATAVAEVLNSANCLTRPLSEPIPEVLRTGAAADIFGRLVRLRDDEVRGRLKDAVAGALASIDLGQIGDRARRRAAELDTELGSACDEAWITQFMFALPVQVIAGLLGIPRERFGDTMTWLGDYGAAAAAAGTGIPAATPELIARGHRGARALLDLVGGLGKDPGRRGPLLDALAREAARVGCDDDRDVVANAIGYMVQGYVGTASLIGLTLLALARRPALREKVDANRALLRPLVQEVARHDTVTSSTFRFMACDAEIAGRPLRKGEMIIVLLAAANRDPALNLDPDRLDIARKDRKSFEFGVGVHACPADKAASLLVEIAVDHLLTKRAPLERLEASLTYTVSGHVRTPLFKG
ncbi:cytochrome P450 [Sphingomonas sp. So64.6b]|uniref:cytochrome P450 n=1 Tax=Sphingomonas sp. So64.6b TaxID=2997354 RepID=UPI0016011A1D|nr:cytochrome P450 [Sphingomonas sp. So64.6b]QNA82602.1 cytochrome P450 [Sphingomonas sp. So64.6b]